MIINNGEAIANSLEQQAHPEGTRVKFSHYDVIDAAGHEQPVMKPGRLAKYEEFAGRMLVHIEPLDKDGRPVSAPPKIIGTNCLRNSIEVIEIDTEAEPIPARNQLSD